MEAVIALVLAGGCLALSYALRRRLQKKQAPRADTTNDEELLAEPAEQDLENMQIDDVLSYEKMDLIVIGINHFTEGDCSWVEYILTEDRAEHWLVVQDDEPDFILLGQEIGDPGLGDSPSSSIDYQGKIFQLKRRGQAMVYSQGMLLTNQPFCRYSYWDYCCAGNDRLWVRQRGEKMLYIFGQRVKRHLLSVLPGG